jgi:hypothetical protein
MLLPPPRGGGIKQTFKTDVQLTTSIVPFIVAGWLVHL